MTPRRWVTSLVTPPSQSLGTDTNNFCIGSIIVVPARTIAPRIALRIAGMVCAGPRWIASSWSFASVSRTSIPMAGSPANGPDLHTSLKPSINNSRVSCSPWIPFVPLMKTFVPLIAYPFLIMSLSIPNSANWSPISFWSLLRMVPSRNSPARRASTTFWGSISTSM